MAKKFDETLTLTLTKAEEQIMQLLWEKERAFVNDLLEMMPEPKPAYNTVSTIIRILEQKGFVGHKKFGNTHQYFPLVSQSEYVSNSLTRLSSTYFQNSYANIVNFFAEEGKLRRKDIEEIEKLLQTLKTSNK
ncbi:MAG: BlaI/MecI/CopY family transcriptional regulator [Bacteroidales bacterium]|jgi:predicted transcriptional regulator|nr:BlaI/MecI/CopY family transcriptional regulator [Bacteroidales bacterium]